MCKDQFNINTFILITKLLEKRINIHNPLDITFSNAKCLWQFPHRKKNSYVQSFMHVQGSAILNFLWS